MTVTETNKFSQGRVQVAAMAQFGSRILFPLRPYWQ